MLRCVYLSVCPPAPTLFIRSFVSGIVIVLFFQCVIALLNPANRKMEGIKWGLVAHTFFMFSFVTIYTATNLTFQSISYIDNREFPGGGGLAPGPLGYQFSSYSMGISVVQTVVFLLNGWLADGLLVGSVFSSVVWRSNSTPSPASSLLCNLLWELLGHRLPRRDVSRLCWYALGLTTRRWRHPRLI